jgi:Domain of unknown function (DUF4917)
MPHITTFEGALGTAATTPKLLVGNGFSIAWSPQAFAYGALLDKADFSGLSCAAADLFGALRTTDFEVVIDRLRAVDAIVSMYEPNSELARRAEEDSAVVREALAVALAANHPHNVGEVSDQSYRTVRQFLAHFDCVYSVNYDLLLYWATMQDIDDGLDVPSGDGFGEDPDEPDAPWVTWDMAKSWRQKVFYLHGALHLYDAGDRLKKLTWIRTGVSLLDQIREQLEDRAYPLVVTEGASRDKKDKILHSAYLSKAMRSFSEIGGDLFVFGLSLAENDEHILEAIVRGKVERLFVSIYGDAKTDLNRRIIERAQLLSEQRASYVEESDQKRRKGRTLDVRFFAAESARVWR